MAHDIVRGLRPGMGLLWAYGRQQHCTWCNCKWGYIDEDDNVLCGQCGRVQK